jgi:hypothetical protein
MEMGKWEGATRRRRTSVDMNSLTLHFTLIWLPVYLSTDARRRARSVAG